MGEQQNLTKQTLGNRSFINQVKYAPKTHTVAIAGTNDGNVQIGFNLGTGVASQASWVNVTGGNVVLPTAPSSASRSIRPPPPAHAVKGAGVTERAARDARRSPDRAGAFAARPRAASTCVSRARHTRP